MSIMKGRGRIPIFSGRWEEKMKLPPEGVFEEIQ